jgi:hypothetical protein
MAVVRKKTALYLDADLVQTAKLIATAAGKHDYEVIEEALEEYVASRHERARHQALDLLDRIAARQVREGIPPLTDDEAMHLANEELHAMRAERRKGERVQKAG